MAIESIPQGKGTPRAKVICDDCGREEVVACAYTRSDRHISQPNASQARAKVIKLGWAYVKGCLRCSACESKRKVIPMKKVIEQQEPTKKQRLEIISMLMEVYDLENECYLSGDTDSTVADVLNVRPGWVSQIREAEFGPDGGNEDIESLKTSLGELEREIKADSQSLRKIVDQAGQSLEKAEKRLAQVSAMRVELDKIRKAVGSHIERKAGLA